MTHGRVCVIEKANTELDMRENERGNGREEIGRERERERERERVRVCKQS